VSAMSRRTLPSRVLRIELMKPILGIQESFVKTNGGLI